MNLSLIHKRMGGAIGHRPYNASVQFIVLRDLGDGLGIQVNQGNLHMGRYPETGQEFETKIQVVRHKSTFMKAMSIYICIVLPLHNLHLIGCPSPPVLTLKRNIDCPPSGPPMIKSLTGLRTSLAAPSSTVGSRGETPPSVGAREWPSPGANSGTSNGIISPGSACGRIEANSDVGTTRCMAT